MAYKELIQQAVFVRNSFSDTVSWIANHLEVLEETRQLQKVFDSLLELVVTQEEVVNFRLEKILTQQHPYMPPVNINRLKEHKYRVRPDIMVLCKEFLRQRHELLEMLRQIPEESWKRKGLHEIDGHLSFADVVRRLNQKDKLVLKQLQQIVAQQGTG